MLFLKNYIIFKKLKKTNAWCEPFARHRSKKKLHSRSFFQNIIWLYGDKRIIFRQKLELNIKKLTKFSIIPLTDLTNLSIDGAEWNLDNKDIQFGETLTLRNKTNEEQLNIRCDKGVFAFIY